CRLGIPAGLHEDIERVAIGVNRPPEPVLPATNWNDDLVQMPLVRRRGPVTPDTIGEMRAKPVDPQPDGFAADDHAALCQKVLDVGRAQSEAMIGPDGISDDLAGKAEALQARQG